MLNASFLLPRCSAASLFRFNYQKPFFRDFARAPNNNDLPSPTALRAHLRPSSYSFILFSGTSKTVKFRCLSTFCGRSAHLLARGVCCPAPPRPTSCASRSPQMTSAQAPSYTLCSYPHRWRSTSRHLNKAWLLTSSAPICSGCRPRSARPQGRSATPHCQLYPWPNSCGLLKSDLGIKAAPNLLT